MRQSPKIRSFHVFCEVYQANVFVILGGTGQKVQKLLKRRFGVDYDEDSFPVGAFSLELSCWPYNVVWIGSSGDFMPKLTHEVFHLVHNILAMRRVPIDGNSTEAGAYLMEFYMRSILAKIAKKK